MITVNGAANTIKTPLSLQDFLTACSYRQDRIAVELNGEIMSTASYESTMLNDGDVLEVVSFVGGG